MDDEFYAYEKFKFERLKYELDVAKRDGDGPRERAVMSELIDFTAGLFEDLELGADIEAEREEVKAERDQLKRSLQACERVIAELRGGTSNGAIKREDARG